MHPKTQAVLDIFKQISAVPRRSKQEEQISAWLQQWGRDRGWEVLTDALHNVLIRVPATPGYEQKPTVVLQGHMDMVCEKTPDSTHDFDNDPIIPIVDGDWLRADRTTLGADNGIGVAMGMALAVDPEVVHPPLELLITTDEESGLTGADHLQPGFVRGRILINIDSEDEGVFIIGCAGGLTTYISKPLSFEPAPAGYKLVRLEVGGLRGGHSGTDINDFRANANKLLARLLFRLQQKGDIRLAGIKGGTVRNAIPRDAHALIACPHAFLAELTAITQAFEETACSEYPASEKGIYIRQEVQMGEPGPGLSASDTAQVIRFVLALPHGVDSMSAAVKGLVETSDNLAVIEIKNGVLEGVTSQRSSVPSRLEAITQQITSVCDLFGAGYHQAEGYPAWQPNPQSPLLETFSATYRRIFEKEPVVDVIHAGLECGIIGAKYPGMEMISVGPTLRHPHSPEERLYLPAVDKIWTLLVEFLKTVN